MDDLEEEAVGPGADLAISLTGVLVALLVVAFGFWASLAISKNQLQDLFNFQQIKIENGDKELRDLQKNLTSAMAQIEKKRSGIGSN